MIMENFALWWHEREPEWLSLINDPTDEKHSMCVETFLMRISN